MIETSLVQDSIKRPESPILIKYDDKIIINPNELKMFTDVKYKKLKSIAHEPTRGSAAAAGYDLYAAVKTDVKVPAHSTVKVGTGLAFELPQNTFAAIFARSGLATKQGLRPANCVGICDSDYRGEYIVAVHNDSEEPRTIVSGDRIAQMILSPYYEMNFTESEDLSKTKRGDGGFGSTGIGGK
jgi:dUTP pyrophosphatase